MSIRSVTYDHRSYHGAITKRKQKILHFVGSAYRKFGSVSCLDKSLDKKFGKSLHPKHRFTSY